MTEAELLQQAVKETLGINPDDFKKEIYNEDGTLKDNALTTVIGKYDNKFGEFKNLATSKYNEGHTAGISKAKAEVLSQFESDILTVTGHKSDKKGIELVKELVDAAKKTSGNAGKELRDSDEYKEMVRLLDSTKGEAEKIKVEFDSYKKQVEFEKKFGSVERAAIDLLDAQFAYWGETPEQIAHNKKLLLRELKESVSDWKVEGNKIIPVDDKGEQLRNDKLNKISFEDIVNANSLHINRDKQRVKGNAGNSNDDSKGGGASGGIDNKYPTPKSAAEMAELVDAYKKKGDNLGATKVYANFKAANAKK